MKIYKNGNVLTFWSVFCIALLISTASIWAATYYVSPDGNDGNDGTSWLLAKQSIQAAVDIAEDDDTVLVTNGLYNTGGMVTPEYAATNRVCVTNVVTLQSVNGPEVTIIEGIIGSNGSNDLDAVRCVYMNNHGTLSGFTLTNGFTMQTGTHLYDASGGGAWLSKTSTVFNCIITGNGSVHGGGAHFLRTSSISDCDIIGNRASDDGGGIQIYGDVTVSNCTFIQNSSLSEGGGIYMEGGTMNNCLLSENTALTGGGILQRSSSHVNDCIISDNSANGGGGVQFIYGGTLNNSLVRNNSAGFGGGVGIHFNGTMNNSVVSGNEALTQGGGVYLTYDGYINNCTITENIGTTNGGGVLLNYGGQMKNCVVWGNQSPEEAGIRLVNMSATGILYTCASDGITHGVNGCITNDPLFVNAANENFELRPSSLCFNAGNNIFAPTNSSPVDFHSKTRIIDSTVDMGACELDIVYADADQANNTGSGRSWVTAKQTIQAATDLVSNYGWVFVTNGVYDTGGAITPGYSLTNRLCITNMVTIQSMNGPTATIIKGAPGSNGSNDLDSIRGVYMTNGCSLIGFTVTNGYTQQTSGFQDWGILRSGGGVWLSDNCTVSDCILSGNIASEAGGGACLYYGGILTNCTVTGNAANDDGGGIICFLAGEVNDCTVSENRAVDYAGGIYFYYYNGVANDCIISQNSSHYAGGAYCYTGGELNRCQILDNTAVVHGGGVSLSPGGVINDSTVSGNYAYYGGGLYFHYGGQVNNCIMQNNSGHSSGGLYCFRGGEINNCLLTANSVSSYGGGATLVQGGTLNNCTLYNNTATTNGGGVYCDGGGTLNNSIVWGNSAPYGTDIDADGTATIQYSCSSSSVTNGTDNCFTNNPLFLDETANNFQIKYESSCRNAGNNIYAPTNITPYDLAGNNRIITSIVDMGAYEVLPVWFECTAGSYGSVTGDSSGWYTRGDSVAVTAVPDTYYTFVVWSGDVPTGLETNSELTLVMDQTRTVAVTFNEAVTTNSPTPHWWLAEYGLTDFENDAESDADNDGILSWEEYIAGTVPINASSALLTDSGETTLFSYDVARTNEFSEIYTTTVSDVSLVLTWPSATGRVYSVNYGTEVGSLDTPLATNLPATPHWNTYTCTVYEVSDSTLYFRIGVELE